MPSQTREVRISQKPGHVQTSGGVLLPIPSEWALLPPGDAALSRRIKADGPSWTVIEVKGNKRFSRGIWAPAARIEALRAELHIERADPAYQKKLDAGRARRAAEQADYEKEFYAAVHRYLAFAPRYANEAAAMARAITAHAVPVGSGTVARTERIPVEQRAEAATIAWMRHQTTAYDHMTIPRVAGRRREVRRMLARRSTQLLDQYRQGRDIDAARCPLAQALMQARTFPASPPAMPPPAMLSSLA
ncbi:DUF2293 domain-containing protein [Opitutaceae bacterium TAV4]|nr:DUF2293 domain-containing protein [Opitutaceae bacterium TAV4]RRJ99741.1 DUF2293 domain-containing protein [Opitutaceae bacterium TAV3]